MAEQMSQGPGYENFMDFYDAARGFLAEMKESIVKKRRWSGKRGDRCLGHQQI